MAEAEVWFYVTQVEFPYVERSVAMLREARIPTPRR
jgi:hypothetical protein